jgi:hypothetical protein
MTVKTKIVEHFFHVGGNVLRVFVAVVTGATAAVVDKIMVALNTLGGAVIGMIELHRYQCLMSGVFIAISLSEKQQDQGEAHPAYRKRPDRTPIHCGL